MERVKICISVFVYYISFNASRIHEIKTNNGQTIHKFARNHDQSVSGFNELRSFNLSPVSPRFPSSFAPRRYLAAAQLIHLRSTIYI